QHVPWPSDLRLSAEGRLAARLRRAERRGLSHHLPGEERQPVGPMAVVLKWLRPPVLGLAAAVVCGGLALAQSEPLAARIALCATCHGEDGNSRMENIPSLAGQPDFFLFNQLFLMREDVRRIEAMAPMVKDMK